MKSNETKYVYADEVIREKNEQSMHRLLQCVRIFYFPPPAGRIAEKNTPKWVADFTQANPPKNISSPEQI